MPLLREEMTGVYFAKARLNTSFLTIKQWRAGAKCPRVAWKSYLGRVLEKTTTYAMTCFRHALSTTDLTAMHTLDVWSDMGPSFHSYEMLGTVCVDIFEDFTTIDDIYINFGEAAEFKNDIDEYFGKCDRILDQERRTLDLLDSPDVIAALQSFHMRTEALRAKSGVEATDDTQEEFYNWKPEPKMT